MQLPDPQTVAAILSEVAKAEILPRFEALERHEITEKAPGDLVTVADTAAEAALERRLNGLIPGAAFVGEEAAETNPRLLDVLEEDDRAAWILDPVDGTHNFANGIACFAVIVALAWGGQTRAGWIHDPLSGETAIAEEGAGAWIAEKRLRFRPPDTVEAMTGSVANRLAAKLTGRRQAGETGIPGGFKRYRCVGREYIDLARGTLHFARYAGRLKPWDHAAGVLLFKESGGIAAVYPKKRPYRPVTQTKGDALILTPDGACGDRLAALLT